jgi:hypothetical protein
MTTDKNKYVFTQSTHKSNKRFRFELFRLLDSLLPIRLLPLLIELKQPD